MKKKISGSRIPERIAAHNLDEPQLIFSKTLFDEALSKSGLMKKVVAKVVETFAYQHPPDEWVASLPLNAPPKKSYDLELVEDIVQSISDYMTCHLPNAFYHASLLIIYQAVFAAFGDRMPEPLLHELEKKIGLKMRPPELRTSDGRGVPPEWSKQRLEYAVDTALSKITTHGAVTLPKVAEWINKLYGDELDQPFKANTLGRLLKRKKIDWLKSRARRKKELENGHKS